MTQLGYILHCVTMHLIVHAFQNGLTCLARLVLLSYLFFSFLFFLIWFIDVYYKHKGFR